MLRSQSLLNGTYLRAASCFFPLHALVFVFVREVFVGWGVIDTFTIPHDMQIPLGRTDFTNRKMRAQSPRGMQQEVRM